jgi:hypothetical protein
MKTHTTLLLVAVVLMTPAGVAHAADEYVLDGTVDANRRCTSVSSTQVRLQAQPTGQAADTNRRVIWRAGQSGDLRVEGGNTEFSVWGNVDLASRIQLVGFPSSVSIRERRRHGGSANAGRGCGSKGSVDLELTSPDVPATASRGRLRFEFSVGNAFEIPITLQPHPESLTLGWHGPTVSQNRSCLQSNGGYAQFSGDTLEIGLNPDNPLPTACQTFAVQYSLSDRRDLPANCRVISSQAVSEVRGADFARGLTENIGACGRRDAAVGGFYPALSFDYAATARALARERAKEAAKANATGRPARTATLDFEVALRSFNNVARSNPPLKVRLVDVQAATRSDLEPKFQLSLECADGRISNRIGITDRSSSSLAITSRRLTTGDGQTFNTTGSSASRTHTYTQNGTYTIRLTATDSSGVQRFAEKSITTGTACPRSSGPVLIGSCSDVDRQQGRC